MTATLILAATALAATLMICLAASRAWRGWLELKRLQLARRETPSEAAEDGIGVRVELACVRERLRQLEAIAEGVEL